MRMTIATMTPIEQIIEKFGGITGLARALGHKNPTTVQGWKERDVIPAQRIPEVIKAGHANGLELTLDDFFEAAA